MLGDITAGPAYRFTQWLELVRKRSIRYRSSGFPHCIHRLDSMPTRYVMGNDAVFIVDEIYRNDLHYKPTN